MLLIPEAQSFRWKDYQPLMQFLLMLVWVALAFLEVDTTSSVLLVPLINSRFFLGTTVFIGNFLFFPRIEEVQVSRKLQTICFVGILGIVLFPVNPQLVNWQYLLLGIINALIVVFYLTFIWRLLKGVFEKWFALAQKETVIGELAGYWREWTKDALKLGLWGFFLLSNAYYYLVNFYLIDPIFYSWLLLIPLLVLIITFYYIWKKQVVCQLQAPRSKIEKYLGQHLQLEELGPGQLESSYLEFNYYTALFRYLKKLTFPIYLYGLLIYYLLLCSGLLWLPEFFQLVVEV